MPLTKEQEEKLREELEVYADLEHQRWAKWQEYLHSRCIENDDGSLTIPAHLVVHWKRQIATPYSQLTEAEKESDRNEVRPYFERTNEALEAQRKEIVEGINQYGESMDDSGTWSSVSDILSLPQLTGKQEEDEARS